MARALALLVSVGLLAGCGTVYTSNENAELIGDFEDILDVDVPPAMVSTVRPEYPDIARKMGAEGVVRLKALILEDGQVAKVQVIGSANPILVDSAITALRQSRFIPAKRDGEPCCGTLVIPFIFGKDETRVHDQMGLEVDHTGGPKDRGFVPVEPPEAPERDIKPGK